MDILANSKIDFMKYRRPAIIVSALLILLAVVSVFFGGGPNLGIDFAGGTQLTVRFRDEPEVDALRALFVGEGVSDAQIQRFGEEAANEVLIKTSVEEGSEEGRRETLVGILDGEFNGSIEGGFDVNQRGTESLAGLLTSLDPDQVGGDADTLRAHYTPVAVSVMAVRQQDGLLREWSELDGVDGVSSTVVAALRDNAQIGSFAVLAAENVGPQIGAELRRKGIMAVVMSLLGMLGYIWFRFELRFGIGALVAVIHDMFITLGLFVLAGFEFNLTTIAGFLTLVGYSVNDSVVVFDRVRENLRRKRSVPLVDVMNRSLNQTLSRTVLTSGTTLLAVGSLLVFGGDVLRGFAFIMTIGVIAGTYSSIYIACPFALLWDEKFVRQAKARRASTSPNAAAKVASR